MDMIAILAVIALILGPLHIYLHNRRIRAAMAAAVAARPLAPLVAHYSRYHMVRLIGAGLAITSTCLVLIFDHRPTYVAKVLLSGGFVAGIAATLLWCYRLICRAGEAVIVVDVAGFWDSRIGPEAIPWSAITRVSETTVRGGDLAGFALTVEGARAHGLSLKRWIDRKLIAASGVRRFEIGFGGLNVAPRTMLSAIRAQIAAQKTK
ncbi:hypothetical protein LQG66_14635 [Bradyrhizobium ontarionense]|uniref:PH domain-containing protein n=1 Tax=Bradyrhizobium ontarionense TaxID=2898149 RepID=A0ABY3RKT2_9BRAD|nr:hypothetical protein [Bradyrhizobium sp. A19]UFZ07466.1 hypothetical protein LQG66_14635 [Bradyrhizobium sp. A19]